jgi:hypothetical protein
MELGAVVHTALQNLPWKYVPSNQVPNQGQGQAELMWQTGAAECLSKETTHLGIQTHVLVLGQFRTQILDDSRKGGNLSPTGLPEYDVVKTEMSDRHKERHGKQPGDPKIAAERIVDIARLDNLSEDESGPYHFAFRWLLMLSR